MNLNMRLVPPELYDLASRLLKHEASGSTTPDEKAAAAQRSCGKLARVLTRSIGADGFHVLTAQALRRAKAEVPFLQDLEIEIQEDGCPTGLDTLAQRRTPAEFDSALVAILANIIWLLNVFIGSDLTLRQIRRAWPDFPLDNMVDG